MAFIFLPDVTLDYFDYPTIEAITWADKVVCRCSKCGKLYYNKTKNQIAWSKKAKGCQACIKPGKSKFGRVNALHRGEPIHNAPTQKKCKFPGCTAIATFSDLCHRHDAARAELMHRHGIGDFQGAVA